MSERLNMSDPFERSVAIEVLLESLGDEIGQFNWLADQVGEDTPDGEACLQVISKLANVRRNVNPGNDEQLAAVDDLLNALSVSRQVFTHQIQKATE